MLAGGKRAACADAEIAKCSQIPSPNTNCIHKYRSVVPCGFRFLAVLLKVVAQVAVRERPIGRIGQRVENRQRLPLEGDRTPWPFLATPAREARPEFSPDGRWVAYRSDESGQNEIYVGNLATIASARSPRMAHGTNRDSPGTDQGPERRRGSVCQLRGSQSKQTRCRLKDRQTYRGGSTSRVLRLRAPHHRCEPGASGRVPSTAAMPGVF